MSAMATKQAQAFDASAYDLPIPNVDGHKADKIVVSFSGQIELDRTSEEDLELIEAFTLGRDVDLGVTATVTKKGFSFSGRDEETNTGYGIGLKVHSIQS